MRRNELCRLGGYVTFLSRDKDFLDNLLILCNGLLLFQIRKYQSIGTVNSTGNRNCIAVYSDSPDRSGKRLQILLLRLMHPRSESSQAALYNIPVESALMYLISLAILMTF